MLRIISDKLNLAQLSSYVNLRKVVYKFAMNFLCYSVLTLPA